MCAEMLSEGVILLWTFPTNKHCDGFSLKTFQTNKHWDIPAKDPRGVDGGDGDDDANYNEDESVFISLASSKK